MKPGSTGGKEEEEEEMEEKKSAKVFAAVFEGTFLASAALSSGSSLPFNFALVTKLLRNMKYLDVTVSSELTETFYSWKVADGFFHAPKAGVRNLNRSPCPQFTVIMDWILCF